MAGIHHIEHNQPAQNRSGEKNVHVKLEQKINKSQQFGHLSQSMLSGALPLPIRGKADKRLPSKVQGNRIWNVLDISAACCGVKENRFYPHGVEARGWGMGWRHLRRVLKVLKIHGLVTPGGTICLKF